jgi:hypothetical protein
MTRTTMNQMKQPTEEKTQTEERARDTWLRVALDELPPPGPQAEIHPVRKRTTARQMLMAKPMSGLATLWVGLGSGGEV